ncbi:MAG: winged helix DNA-binding protein [Lachnospiraceae bacterium]|nr:winged helix DNA-binding protein [Lachnospiraceae bacterium]
MEDMDEILRHYGVGESFIISAIQVKKNYEKMCAKAIEGRDLTQNEVDIMLFLCHNEQIDTSAGIARYRCLSKSQVCKSVDALTRDGYLFVRQDKKDRRYQHLQLSERGFEIIGEIEKCRREFLDKMREGISEEELENFLNVLRKIRKNVTSS